ncbi:RNA ligase family protein [Pseudobacteroides cellulosolvens]|uniref:RNA ligase domain, REL/Rln2 n=1 Tax=Pseudobacteroides cellulosolvens ATCC 35603 = DSM 2933 TaxID=398512 RepID=A0A0L6JSZ3_9FIRM|nr:RNA ligase family protein [Pseudobacteroides cellulosolvens]KNY28810.1 RNA ligase domain, REL/Rln2 [Pseudobacteroides cellulosolvens ATCC 35603 = DSM 2933]
MTNEIFIKYPDMKTLFKLIPSDKKGKKWDATSGEILPETAALHFIPIDQLVFTEKIDGTNMGIRVDDGSVVHIQKREHICSRDDRGDAFYFEVGDNIAKIIEDNKIDQLKNVIIYGELCGAKIQKGGNYFSDRKFIIFDIYDSLANKFFTWDAVKHFANELGVEIVPEINYDKEDLKVDSVKEFVLGLKSVYNDGFGAEGIVVRYAKDTTNVKRWMAKIRKKDFKE